MARIVVRREGESFYRVTVDEGGDRTEHRVEVSHADLARYGRPGSSPERLVEATLEFLLEREPKESILRRFSLSVVERYFPEYRDRIRDRL